MKPLSRTGVSLIYLVELAILAYFAYSASHGRLELPNKHGTMTLHGWAAWLTGLVPMSFAALTYFRFDPSVQLSVVARKRLILACGLVAIFTLMTAIVFGTRP